MELKVEIEFDQLLDAIRQLTADKKSLLQAELSSPSTDNQSKPIDNFREFLLRGPVMKDDQYKLFKENRNHFNKWRTK